MSIGMENKGEIIACDLHASKLSLIEKGAKKLEIDIISVKEQNGKLYYYSDTDISEKRTALYGMTRCLTVQIQSYATCRAQGLELSLKSLT